MEQFLVESEVNGVSRPVFYVNACTPGEAIIKAHKVLGAGPGTRTKSVVSVIGQKSNNSLQRQSWS